MCGLFGFINYGYNISVSELNNICNALAHESEERGSHATGIAYTNNNKLYIEKAPKPAHKMRFRLPYDVVALMGHTRHSTQGSEKRNANNHPFIGYTGKQKQFALAHNGILYNDRELRKSLKLPPTKIETDSYIAVQLIEQQKALSHDSLKYMAEKVRGSFSFSVIDHTGKLYLVKGDSPIAMLHFEELGLYIYASTEQILWRAISNTALLKFVRKAACSMDKCITPIEIKDGTITCIGTTGKLTSTKFDYDTNMGYGFNWWERTADAKQTNGDDDEHLQNLIAIAPSMGYNEDDIMELVGCGFSPSEIEELLYEPEEEFIGMRPSVSMCT